MPDYNPAVALGLHPPENSLAQTFNTIANLQQSQAHTGLYTLQAAQQQRQLTAQQAYAGEMRASGDSNKALQAYTVNGGDPSGLVHLITATGAQNELARGGGVSAAATREYAGAAEAGAKTTEIGAETKKIGIETQTAELGRGKASDEAALRKANMFLANPDQPQFLADAFDAHMAANPPSNELERADHTKMKLQLLNAPKPQQMAVARAYGAIDPTPEQKNAVASGLNSPLQYETAKKTADFDVTQYGNVLEGLSGSANAAAAMLPNIHLAKSLINDPSFYSGTAEGTVLGFKKALAGLGLSPDAAVPQEAFRKVMAANILHQIDDLKSAAKEMGSSTSRIFAPQIELMEKAAQNPDNTVAGNRFLAEVQERAANRSMKIGDMAADYKIKNGKLDEGFIKQLRKWSVDNPMFTKEELANPKSLAAPPAKEAATQFSEGQTATNPATKERLVFQGGKWVPHP